MLVTIYHNPRCSKSRKALELISAKGVQPRVIEYLRSPPDADTLRSIVKMLGVEPRALIRTNEAPYEELNLADSALSDEELIAAMVDNPILIERPIVVADERAAIGRPPENIERLLEA